MYGLQVHGRRPKPVLKTANTLLWYDLVYKNSRQVLLSEEAMKCLSHARSG